MDYVPYEQDTDEYPRPGDAARVVKLCLALVVADFLLPNLSGSPDDEGALLATRTLGSWGERDSRRRVTRHPAGEGNHVSW